MFSRFFEEVNTTIKEDCPRRERRLPQPAERGTFKSLAGQKRSKKANGRTLSGREWNNKPEQTAVFV